MTLEAFIDRSWSEHGDDLAGVVARLPEAWPLLDAAPERLGDLVQLVEHLVVGHQGDAAAMQPWLARFARLAERQPAAAPLVERARLATRLLQAEPVEATPLLDAATAIRAHGLAACGCTARGEPARARALMRDAAALARDAASDAAAQKAWAAACNNLASQLLDDARQPEADALMLDMAAHAREAWQRAGTWLHVQRADYLLARCAAAVGDGDAALAHAQRGLAICEENQADTVERFFAHEALARAQHARHDTAAAGAEREHLRALLAEVSDADSRSHAEKALQRLG